MGVMLSRNNNPDYNKLINKPSILTDDQVAWDEIINKPSVFPSSSPGIFSGSFAIRITGTDPGIRFDETDETEDSNWYLVADGKAFQLQIRDNDFTYIDYVFRVDRLKNFYFNGGVIVYNLPSSPIGLANGTLYKDANNFVKIV